MTQEQMIQFAIEEGFANAAEIHLAKRLRAGNVPGFIVGASGCSLCSPCKQTLGQPCSFPEFQYSCMSAYCIFVKKLADVCGMEYDCGDGLLAFFGMYVFD
jgi:predicted metal-binding protein